MSSASENFNSKMPGGPLVFLFFEFNKTFKFSSYCLTYVREIHPCFVKASKNKLNWMEMFVDLFLDVFDHNFAGSTEMKKFAKCVSLKQQDFRCLRRAFSHH